MITLSQIAQNFLGAGKADAIDWLRCLSDRSIDLIITDPAYESLEKHRKIGTTTRLKSWFETFPNDRYQMLFIEAYRVLVKNAHMYVLCDEETLFVIKPIAEAAGFKFWKSIIWDKGSIGTGYHYRNQTERIAFFEKGKRKLNNLGTPDILSFKRIVKGYPTEKPIELFDVLVTQSTTEGEIVADCFFGSGNSLLSAIKNNRKATGCDISDAAHDYFCKRLHDEAINYENT